MNRSRSISRISALLLVPIAGLSLQATSASAAIHQTTAETSVDTVAVTEAHYRVYSATGEALTWEDLTQAMAGAEVILVGEYHDDPVAHHVQERTLRSVISLDERPAAASMEMFTRDAQGVLDEYLSGIITERLFRAESRPWSNYETDYRPFVEAAREAGIPVIAANAPRRYVNRVTRLGPGSLAELSVEAKRWVAPLPYEGASPAYRAEWNALMMEAMGGMMAAADSSGEAESGEEESEEDESEQQATTEGEASATDSEAAAPMHGMGYALDSQSLWDATMAWSIVEHLTRNPGTRVVHIVGGFHVRNGTGTPEQILRYRPGTKIVNIVVEPVDDVGRFNPEEHAGIGDFVILGDASLPRTMGGSR